jgi:serine/threonine protein kinase/tetratricopeptide (TPR) repeat protein
MSEVQGAAVPWERVKDLLYEALQLAPAQRASYLDAACAGDAALRAKVVAMLEMEAAMHADFLESPVVEELPAAAGDGLAEGQLFAERFRLVRRLGEGGMGQVWLAEQTAPVRRQVALKLIKAGMYDASVAQRFIMERQSVAIMDHPAIAKVLEAGATQQGQPYFIMEYVAGLPITEYCDQKKLGIRARLELFIKACEGVQHAHLKAVIHRDLKPPNVLVVEVDGNPVPRIIDFGLAKAVGAAVPNVEHPAELTRFGLMMGTPGYMSPEQLQGGVQDIDTRTDVYSLGVILYLLLTGLQPFETRRGQRPPLDVWLRQLREEDPPAPSAKLSGDPVTGMTSAAERATVPKSLIASLRGDLDWIVLKALERDRDRRYESPTQLAVDLRRYLDHEPVAARPASPSYRLRKHLRRHRLALGVAGGLVLLLSAFSVLQGLQLHRTAQERDRANQERDRANLERERANQERDAAARITDFMTGMFKVVDPSEARGNSVTAREILDRASKDIQSGLAQDPRARSQMMQVMATTYMNLGLYRSAEALATALTQARLALLGPEHRDTLAARDSLAMIVQKGGHPLEAEQQQRALLADERRILGADDDLTLLTMGHLAYTEYRNGEADAAEKLARDTIDSGSRHFGEQSAVVRGGMNVLGSALMGQDRFAEAEPVYRHLLAIQHEVLAPDQPEILRTRLNLALALGYQGRNAEAEPLMRETLGADRRVMGPDHASTLLLMEALADLLAREGRYAEAETLYRDTWAARSRTLGPDHPDTLRIESYLGASLWRAGQLTSAEKLERAALKAQRRVLGNEHRETIESQATLAHILIRRGRFKEAEPLAREAFDITHKHAGFHANLPITTGVLGLSMAHTHRYAEASKLFEEMLETQKDPAARSRFWYEFAKVAAAAEDPDGALRYLRQAFDAGYKDYDELSHDPDLEELHSNPKFEGLVAELKR